MSLVVAIKHKDRIILGSDKQVSVGANKSHDTTKIWQVKDLPGVIMGSVGLLRASQVIQHNKIFDLNAIEDDIDTGFIINSVVPVIVAQLKAHGVLCGELEEKDSTCTIIPNSFIIALEDKAWVIGGDLSVVEVEDYFTIGSGSDVATGVLFATPEKNPFERVVTAIDAAAETTLYVDNGVDILATKYYPADAKQIAKAVGAEELFKAEKQAKENKK